MAVVLTPARLEAVSVTKDAPGAGTSWMWRTTWTANRLDTGALVYVVAVDLLPAEVPLVQDDWDNIWGNAQGMFDAQEGGTAPVTNPVTIP